MMNFVVKMMKFIFKMMNSVVKMMMDFDPAAGIHHGEIQRQNTATISPKTYSKTATATATGV